MMFDGEYLAMERIFDEAYRQQDEARAKKEAEDVAANHVFPYGADGFLTTLRDEPWLMNAAPLLVCGADMDRRVSESWHSCIRCGKRAGVALVADTTLGPRWLDLCQADRSWIEKHATPEVEYTL